MRIRLVFAPGSQASLDSLCPKTSPVMLAGMLCHEGIPTDYMDFGYLGAFEGGTDGIVASDTRGRKGWTRFLGRHEAASAWGDVVASGDAAAQATSMGNAVMKNSPSLIAWYVENRDGYRMTKALSGYVRRQAPEIHQTLMGPYIARFGASALSDVQTVDTGVTGDMATALAALHESIRVPETWRRIPGLIIHHKSGIVCSPRNIHPQREVLPTALDAVPQSANPQYHSGQFALYPITFIGDCSRSYGFKPGAERPLQKSVARVIEEMRLLSNQYGAEAFHIDAPHVGSSTFERFADALLTQNYMAIYSLGGLSEPFGPGLADRLFASGCRAVGFHAPSGSQRLLEDFYGCDMSISVIRATLRHCHAAGLFTVAHLQYPCPKDDYHTRAETELFLEACRPDGISITAPELTPDSLWFMRAPEYGFMVDHRAFQQWVSCAGEESDKAPYRMYGWKNGRAVEARRSLEAAAEELGCVTGVTERHGLLARIARSVMDESVFLEQLKHALADNDVMQLSRLMACVNETVDTLRTTVTSAGRTAEAL